MAGTDAVQSSRSPLLIGGAAVLGVGALVGLAFLASSLMASGRDLDLAWLPPDSEVIVRVEVAELWNAPLLEPVRKHPMVGFMLGMSAGQYGLGLDDIESITIGVAGLSDAMAANGPDAPPDFTAGDAIIVVRTRKDIPIKKVTTGATEQEHAGTTCYSMAQDDGPPLAAFFPAKRTAVLGPENSVRAAIDRGDAAPDRPELAFAELDQHLVFIMVPKDPAVMAQVAEQQARAADAEDELSPELVAKLRGLSVGLTVTEGVDFQVRLDCADAEAAERVQAELEQALEKGRGAFGLIQAAAEPEQAEALTLVERMLNDATVTRSSTTVEVTAALPRETNDVLARSAESLNPFAMNGGGAGDSGFGGFEGFGPTGKVPVAPEPVSVDEFNESWQVDLNVENQPAESVLISLANGLSLELDSGPDVAEAVQKPVSLAVEDVSRFSAIEMVCAAVGIHATYPEGGGIKLQPGPRPSPAAFAGPFLVEVESFDVFAEYASGHLKLRVLTAGLPPGPMHAASTNGRDVFSIEAVIGPDEEDLINQDEGISTYYSDPSTAEVVVRSEAVNLKNLLRRVDRLSAIQGRVLLSLPTATERIEITDLKEGAAGSSGDIRITLTSATLDADSSMLDFRYEGAGYDDVVFVPLDGDGEPLPVSGTFGGGSDDNGQTTITVDGRPASVAATVVTAREELEYEFRLEDVPVPQASERPEELPPLEFGDQPAPVSVETLSLDRNETPPKAMVSATNHSNKDVRKLEFQLDYLDAQGQKLDDWQASYSGEAAFGDQRPPIAVRSSEKAQFELVAFFLPDNASRVEARLLRVICADGTVWEAPDAE